MGIVKLRIRTIIPPVILVIYLRREAIVCKGFKKPSFSAKCSSQNVWRGGATRAFLGHQPLAFLLATASTSLISILLDMLFMIYWPAFYNKLGNIGGMTTSIMNYFPKLVKTYTLSSANANSLTLAIAFSCDCPTATDNVPCFDVQLFQGIKVNMQWVTGVLLTLQKRRRNKKPRVS